MKRSEQNRQGHRLGQLSNLLAAYVFDSQGNCVAWDHFSSPKTADDLVVVWHPTEEAAYSIDVLNAGFDVNVYQIALHKSMEHETVRKRLQKMVLVAVSLAACLALIGFSVRSAPLTGSIGKKIEIGPEPASQTIAFRGGERAAVSRSRATATST